MASKNDGNIATKKTSMLFQEQRNIQKIVNNFKEEEGAEGAKE